MDPQNISNAAQALAVRAVELAQQAAILAQNAAGPLVGGPLVGGPLVGGPVVGGLGLMHAPPAAMISPFVFLLAIFMLACFVGYYVVWNVTPALHSPLMAVTNAISSVIIVGAMLATGLGHGIVAHVFGFLAVTLASVNIFGGFAVTQRMLSMFRANKQPAKKQA